MVSFCFRKIFPFCVDQIKKINFLYFFSLNGLGDQIRIFFKILLFLLAQKNKSKLLFFARFVVQLNYVLILLPQYI